MGTLLTDPDYAAYRLEIAGHTDSMGAPRHHQLLSRNRAEAVKRYLVERFPIDPQRLVVQGYGETQAMASNDTPEGRSRDRRVELVNVGKE